MSLKSPKPYGRHFAVVRTSTGHLIQSFRTGKQAQKVVDEINVHVIQVSKPLPNDVGQRYAEGKPYNAKDV